MLCLLPLTYSGYVLGCPVGVYDLTVVHEPGVFVLIRERLPGQVIIPASHYLHLDIKRR